MLWTELKDSSILPNNGKKSTIACSTVRKFHVSLDENSRMKTLSQFLWWKFPHCKKLSSGKSKGFDVIPSEMFKFDTVKVLGLISRLFYTDV